MIEPDTLKIVATIFSIVGSGLLAWRVKQILSALSLVVGAHEVNIQQLMPDHHGDIYNLGNSTAHVDRAQGTKLLVFGFLCFGVSGILNLVALIL